MELLLPAVALSLLRGMLGFLLSLALALPLGAALARREALDRSVGALLTAIQCLPSAIWSVLALGLLRASESAILLVVLAVAVPPAAIAMRAALKRGDIHTGRELLSRSLPALRLGWAYAWRGLMGAEIMDRALRVGLGSILRTAQSESDLIGLLGLALLILALGLAVDRCVFAPLVRRAGA
jgi:NitT/TauT family transport system permease protein